MSAIFLHVFWQFQMSSTVLRSRQTQEHTEALFPSLHAHFCLQQWVCSYAGDILLYVERKISWVLPKVIDSINLWFTYDFLLYTGAITLYFHCLVSSNVYCHFKFTLSSLIMCAKREKITRLYDLWQHSVTVNVTVTKYGHSPGIFTAADCKISNLCYHTVEE